MSRITTRALAAATATISLALGASACSALDSAPQGEVEATPAALSSPGALCDLGSCEAATVDRVIDGDTLDVATDTGEIQRVRVLGIDTPETVHPDKPVECMGPEASATATELASAGTSVTLITDDRADSVDDYDRQLAHVVIDDTNLGATMLERGLAETTSFPHSLADDYAAVEDQARETAAGLWGQC